MISTLQQQPDASITLPVHLSRVHAKTLKFDTRGVAEHWTDKDDWVEWEFLVSQPGTFDVAAITSEQKYGANWEGGHHIAVRIGEQEIKGTINRDGKVENPANPYWPYVLSKLGRIRIDKAGTYKLTLKPDSIESAKSLGLTLVSLDLKKVP